VFKKMIALMMIVSIFTANAKAASNSGLKAAFDELNYSLNVEWDQKNKDFYTEKMKEFSTALRAEQAKGLTNEQLIAFVKTEVKDAKIAKDLETAFNMISLNKMSSQDAAKYMTDTMKKSYANGASWSGNAGTTIIVAVVLIAIVIAAATGNLTISSSRGGYCSDVYVCDTVCYDDYYYGTTCSDDCYWSCY